MKDLTRFRELVSALYPVIVISGRYAAEIQSRIATQDEKSEYGENFFATALSDADLSVQTMVEGALLGLAPDIRFFGEEHASSHNTKYFRGTDFGGDGELLVILDPIDGTRCYIDQRSDYQIILSVANAQEYLGVLIARPSIGDFYYGERGGRLLTGALTGPFEAAKPATVKSEPTGELVTGFGTTPMKGRLSDRFNVWCSETDYTPIGEQPGGVSAILTGKLDGQIFQYGNLIDSYAIAFLASLNGYVISDHAGRTMPPLRAHTGMRLPGFVVSRNQEIHREILARIRD